MSITQQQIITTLYTEIDRLIGGVVGNRVYDTEAPQDTDLPCVVFTVVADSPIPYFIDNYTNIDIQVNIFDNKSNGMLTTRAINDALADGLDRAHLRIDTNNVMNVKNTIRGISTVENDIINIRSEYNIF